MIRLYTKFLYRLCLLGCVPLCCIGDELLSEGLGPDELQARLASGGPPLIVDLRKPWEYKIGHIPGAVNIPIEKLHAHAQTLDDENGVVIYCINGTRTREAEPVLLDAGVRKLYHLEGTFQAWIQSGLRIEKGQR